MIEEIKIMLGSAAENFTEDAIGLAAQIALMEVEDFCNTDADAVMMLMAAKIAVQNLLRTGTNGLTSQSFSGVSESYVDGWTDDVKSILMKKRKVKVM